MNERLIINKPKQGEQLPILTTGQIKELSAVLNAMFVRLQKKLLAAYGENSEQVKSLKVMADALLARNFETVADLELQYKLVKNLMKSELSEKPESFAFFVKHFLSDSNKENRELLGTYAEAHKAPEAVIPEFEVFNVTDESKTESGSFELKTDLDYQVKPENKVLVEEGAVILPTIPPEILLKNEQLKYKNQLIALREGLLEKQTKLAHFGTLKTLFKKKEKQALEAAIKVDQEKIEKLQREKLIQGIHSFCAGRSVALENRIKQQQEEEQKHFAGKLYAFYEKYFMKKVLPEKMREKLEKQGFLGRLLANGCTMNAALSLSLLGGGLAIGGASIVGAGILSGRRLLSGAASGVGSYNIMKLGSDAWAKSHGWDKELSDVELNNLSVDNLINYLAHYEARVALNGKTVNGDLYYRKMSKTLESKLGQKRVERNLDDKLWSEYVLKQENLLDERLQAALAKKVKEKSRLKYYATAVGVFVGSGMLQKTLGYLFSDKTPNAPATHAPTDGTLLAEQTTNAPDVLPTFEETMDLSSETSVDYSLIPELAEQPTQAGEILVADQSLAPVEEVLTPVTERTVEMLKESFVQNHSLIEKVGGAVEIVNGKTQVIFDISVGGDFELKQQALRRVMMDVFPIQEVLDKDGLSALDIGRIESNVATFTKLLEGKSFHGFNPDVLKDVMHFEGKQLIITDYEKLAKLSGQVLAESKNWVPDVGSGFVRVGQNTGNHIWESMLNAKMANIKT